VSQLAASGRTIDEAVRESQLRGKEIRTSATGTAHEIGKAVDTLLAAREVFDRSAKEINGLRDSLGVVDDFATTISEIASQTNLLALNAAIEAARAGDAWTRIRRRRRRGAQVGGAEFARRARGDGERQPHSAKACSVRRARWRVARRRCAMSPRLPTPRDRRSRRFRRPSSAWRMRRRACPKRCLAMRAAILLVEEAIAKAGDTAQSHAASAQEVAAATEETSASVEELEATSHMLNDSLDAYARARE
jgi:methyl-accepting chemotaxis protein